ncbi:MAG: histidine kinase [Bacteroidetes bacterium]|nr:histidine kinase [Bacteroidota bacterium]
MTHQKLYLRIILLSSLSVGAIYLVLSIIRNDEHQLLNLILDFFKIFGFALIFWAINLSLYTFLIRRISLQLTYLIIIVIGSIVAYYAMLLLSTYLSILTEVRGIKTAGIGFRGIVANLLIVTFLYSTNIFNKFKEIEAENERLKRNQLENQLSQLKAQLNPHFLFNSLSTLKAMVENHDDNSVEYLIKLSEVYRYLLENSTSHLISIKEELKIANAYFFMLKSRFENNIQLKINLSDEDLEERIPAMSLQLLIENAVKHNVISKGKHLTIEIARDGSKLLIINNLQPKRTWEESTKIGLKNLNNRSKILTHKEIEVQQTEREFIVKIPLT